MIRAEIKPELLSWARERAGLEMDALAHRFPKLVAWVDGTIKPTLKPEPAPQLAADPLILRVSARGSRAAFRPQHRCGEVGINEGSTK